MDAIGDVVNSRPNHRWLVVGCTEDYELASEWSESVLQDATVEDRLIPVLLDPRNTYLLGVFAIAVRGNFVLVLDESGQIQRRLEWNQIRNLMPSDDEEEEEEEDDWDY